MAERMESTEPECGGTTKPIRSGDPIRPLPASEQFHTRSCARCSGLLVTEWYYGSHTTGEHSIETLRCVQCGYRVDPVILQNQIRLPVENQQVQRVRQRYFTRAGMLSELT